MKPKMFGWLMAIAGALAPLSVVQAQYPEKPLRWILTQPPGGANDILGRPVTQRLSEAIGQPIVVDNRGGAGGNIGAAAGAKAPADGYTVTQLSITHSISASLYAKLDYSFLEDFAPVTLLATGPNVLAVHPAVPVKTVRDVIALAKARPGEITYSSSGSGTPNHLAAELFNYMTGVRMLHVPYKGGGNSMIGLVSGEVMLSFASMPSSIGHIRAGRLKPIAVSTLERSPALPELPTISEAGVPGYEAKSWFGLFAPTGTPKEIIARLNTEIHKVLKRPDVIKALDTAGLAVRASTPVEAASFARNEVEKWAKVVRAAKMRAE